MAGALRYAYKTCPTTGKVYIGMMKVFHREFFARRQTKPPD